jgi:hypothetical protein
MDRMNKMEQIIGNSLQSCLSCKSLLDKSGEVKMKNKLHLIIVAILCLGILILAATACERSKETGFTGKLTFLEEAVEAQEWTDDQGFHMRAKPMKYKYESSDERINGWASELNNFDIKLASDQETWKSMEVYSTSTITSDEAGKDILWLCQAMGASDEEGKLSVDIACTGRGKYQGLKAEFTVTGSDKTFPEYEIKGVIIE